MFDTNNLFPFLIFSKVKEKIDVCIGLNDIGISKPTSYSSAQ
jgi:hypothetical protein